MQLRKCALQEQDTQKDDDATNLLSSLAGYTKEAKGIDMWSPSEWRKLPYYLQEIIASAMATLSRRYRNPLPCKVCLASQEEVPEL